MNTRIHLSICLLLITASATVFASDSQPDFFTYYKQIKVIEVPLPPPQEIRAKIKPLIWRCQIDELSCSIILSEIDSVGMQNYIVDGKVEVTEATVALKSRTFVRFYFIENADQGGILGGRIKQAEDKGEEASGKLMTPALTPTMQNTLQGKVIKNYPTTTHSQTVEYRVTNKLLVKKIYQSVDKSLLEYKAIPLVEEEQVNIIRSIDIKQEEKND